MFWKVYVVKTGAPQRPPSVIFSCCCLVLLCKGALTCTLTCQEDWPAVPDWLHSLSLSLLLYLSYSFADLRRAESLVTRSCGLMDKALVFGTKDHRSWVRGPSMSKVAWTGSSLEAAFRKRQARSSAADVCSMSSTMPRWDWSSGYDVSLIRHPLTL